MTDYVRIHNRREEEKNVLDNVDSAIQTNIGVLVEFSDDHPGNRHQKHYEGYELVGFGR